MFCQKKIDFINGIQYLKLEDITNNKCTLEGLKRLCPMFNEYNPLTYTIYLNSRPDLPEHEKIYYRELIERLIKKEKQLVDEALKILEDSKPEEHNKDNTVLMKYFDN